MIVSKLLGQVHTNGDYKCLWNWFEADTGLWSIDLNLGDDGIGVYHSYPEQDNVDYLDMVEVWGNAHSLQAGWLEARHCGSVRTGVAGGHDNNKCPIPARVLQMFNCLLFKYQSSYDV